MAAYQGVNIRDVAEKAGVSIAAVSRVLNKKPNVSEAMKAKVTEACSELGYQINASIQDFIRKGRNGSTRNIAYVVVANSIASPTYAQSLDGMAEVVDASNYNLSLAKLSGQEKSIYGLPPLLRDGRIDGILLTGNLNESIASVLKECGKPIVILGSYPKAICGDLPSVALDYEASFYEIVKALKGLGKTRIAIFHEAPNEFQEQTANNAYSQALTDCGLSFDRSLIFKSGKIAVIDSIASLKAAFSAPELPFDAAICMNYTSATVIGHLLFAHASANGRELDTPLATLWPFATPTLQIPALYFDMMFKDAASKGATMLIDILTGKDSHKGQRIELATQRLGGSALERQGGGNAKL